MANEECQVYRWKAIFAKATILTQKRNEEVRPTANANVQKRPMKAMVTKVPTIPEAPGLQVAKRSVRFVSMEIHVSPNDNDKHPYRLFMHHGILPEHKSEDCTFGEKQCYYFESSEDALSAYAQFYERYTHTTRGYSACKTSPHPSIGSYKYREYVRETQFSPEALSPEVSRLIELLWAEAAGELYEQLAVSPEQITLERLDSAEAVLTDIRDVIRGVYTNEVPGEEDEVTTISTEEHLKKLSDELYKHIPMHHPNTVHLIKQVSRIQDVCQLIRDMKDVEEALPPGAKDYGPVKLYALQCSIDEVTEDDADHYTITNSLLERFNTESEAVHVRNVYKVRRLWESEKFTHQLHNKQLLFHASKPAHIAGILSRGLLMPNIVVDDHGGTRSDAGILGDGLYFSDLPNTCAKYSAPCGESGSRFLFIHEVALGNCLSTYSHNKNSCGPPTGYHSIHGVKATADTTSEFKDDEYVIYNSDQQRIKYLVEFTCSTDKQSQRKTESVGFIPSDAPTLGQICSSISNKTQPLPNNRIIGVLQTSIEELKQKIDLSDVENVKDPLGDVQLGLVAVESSQQAKIALTSSHVRVKMLDFVAKVVLLQSYTNTGDKAIEGKYVFAVDELAVVSGFEAFINGKHMVGEVKEKEKAHVEYKEALQKGHGAYLMEQEGETPDVSVVSVGNLPAGAQVLIKITYITELRVEGNNIVFSLASNLPTPRHSEFVTAQSKNDLDMVRVYRPWETSVQVSIEMPFDIKSIRSPSHQIRIKKTETKAVVELDKDETLNTAFTLQVAVASVHSPRMWVESHPDGDDSRACMLSFYPEFEVSKDTTSELILLLDMSNSMSVDDILIARKALLMCLNSSPQSWTFNMIIFGTGFVELFPRSKQNSKQNRKLAFSFLQDQNQHYGRTDVYGALRQYFLLPTTGYTRNVFLFSDGNVTSENVLLQAIHDNHIHNRVFTMGLGENCNKHLMRKLARVGAGAFEYFDSKRKSQWQRLIKDQLQRAAQPVLTSLTVHWEQFDHIQLPVQAPLHISSLFSGTRLVIYGFVPNCTQATLKAKIGDKEVSTLVSTPDLCITTGIMLHQLTARSVIRDWEDGMLNTDKTVNNVIKRKRRNYIINLSQKFSIVSQFTSFVAVERRSADEDVNTGPSLTELVADEDVDTLDYIGWDNATGIEKDADKIVETRDIEDEWSDEAIQKMKDEFNGAIAELDTVSEDTYKESILHLQELRDTITLAEDRKARRKEGKSQIQNRIKGIIDMPDTIQQDMAKLSIRANSDQSHPILSTEAVLTQGSIQNKTSVIIHEKEKKKKQKQRVIRMDAVESSQSVVGLFGSANTSTKQQNGMLFEANIESSNTDTIQRREEQFGFSNAGNVDQPQYVGGRLFGTLYHSPQSLFGTASNAAQTQQGNGEPFRAPSQSTGRLFGTASNTDQTQQGSGELFEDGSQTTGGLFGSVSNVDQPQQVGGGLFGAPSQSTGSLFGTTSSTNRTQQGSGGLFEAGFQTTGGLFGSVSNVDQPQQVGGGLFGAPSQSTGSLFGTASNIDQTQQGRGGLFGAPSQSAGDLFCAARNADKTQQGSGGLFGTPSQTTGGLFGSVGKEGQPQQVGGGLFRAQCQPTGSLFGAAGNADKTQQGSGGLFGAPSHTAGGLSDSGSKKDQPQHVGGGLFGAPSQSTGNPFKPASNAYQPQQGGAGLLRAPSQPTGGWFGFASKVDQPQQVEGGLFGAPSQSTGSLFGDASNTDQTQQGKRGLFGAPPQSTVGLVNTTSNVDQTQQGSRGLFVAPSQSAGGLFGAASNADQTQQGNGGLFGAPPQSTVGLVDTASNANQTQQGSRGLFETPSQTTGGLFGSASIADQSQEVRGALCGAPSKPTRSLFCTASNEDQPQKGGGGLFGAPFQSTIDLVDTACNANQTLQGSRGFFETPTQTPGGLFGSARIADQSQDGGGGLSGAPSQPSGSLFGTASNAGQPQEGRGGLFGTQSQPIGSLFGTASNADQPQRVGRGPFGAPSQPTGSLLGIASNADKPQEVGGGLFGVQSQPTGTLFGVVSNAEQTQNGSGGLFGAPSQATRCLFGTSTNTEHTQSAFSFDASSSQTEPAQRTSLSAGFGSSAQPSTCFVELPQSQSTQSTFSLVASISQTQPGFGSSNQQTSSPAGFGSSTQPSASSGISSSYSRSGFGSSTQSTYSFGASTSQAQSGFSLSTQKTSSPAGFGSCTQPSASFGAPSPSHSQYGVGSSTQQTSSFTGFGSSTQQSASFGAPLPSHSQSGVGSSTQSTFSFGVSTAQPQCESNLSASLPLSRVGVSTSQSQSLSSGFGIFTQPSAPFDALTAQSQSGILSSTQSTSLPSGFDSSIKPLPSYCASASHSQSGLCTCSYDASTTQTQSGFGSTVHPAPSFGGFGASAQPSASFAASTTQPQSGFGSSVHPAPSFGGFGASAQPSASFAASTTQPQSGFGSSVHPAPSFGGFGASAHPSSSFAASTAQPQSGFGSSVHPAPSFGGFGASAQPSASFAASPAQPQSGFGSSVHPAPSFGGFGASAHPSSSFAASTAQPQSGFGSSVHPAPSFGGFGASAQPLASFAASTTQPQSGFGSSVHPAPSFGGFGASAQPPASFAASTAQPQSGFDSSVHPAPSFGGFGAYAQPSASIAASTAQPQSGFGSSVHPAPSFGGLGAFAQPSVSFAASASQPQSGFDSSVKPSGTTSGSGSAVHPSPTFPLSLGPSPEFLLIFRNATPTQQQQYLHKLLADMHGSSLSYNVPDGSLHQAEFVDSGFGGFGIQQTVLRGSSSGGSGMPQAAFGDSGFGVSCPRQQAAFGGAGISGSGTPHQAAFGGSGPSNQTAFGGPGFGNPGSSNPAVVKPSGSSMQLSSTFDLSTQKQTVFGFGDSMQHASRFRQPSPFPSPFGSSVCHEFGAAHPRPFALTHPFHSSIWGHPQINVPVLGGPVTELVSANRPLIRPSSFVPSTTGPDASQTKRNVPSVQTNPRVQSLQLGNTFYTVDLFGREKIVDDLKCGQMNGKTVESAWLSFEEQRALFYYYNRMIRKPPGSKDGAEANSKEGQGAPVAPAREETIVPKHHSLSPPCAPIQRDKKNFVEVTEGSDIVNACNEEKAPTKEDGRGWSSPSTASTDLVSDESHMDAEALALILQNVPQMVDSSLFRDHPHMASVTAYAIKESQRQLVVAGLNSLGEETAKQIRQLVTALIILHFTIQEDPERKRIEPGSPLRRHLLTDVFDDLPDTKPNAKPCLIDFTADKSGNLFTRKDSTLHTVAFIDELGKAIEAKVAAQRFLKAADRSLVQHYGLLACLVSYCYRAINKYKSVCSTLEIGKSWLQFSFRFVSDVI